MKKRLFSLLLLVSLLVTMSVSFYGCENSEENESSAQVSYEDNTFFGLALPDDLDFEGQTVKVLTTSVTETVSSYQIKPECNSLYTAENATAAISAAAESTRLVEERLNIQVEEECIITLNRGSGEMYQRIYTDVMSQTVDYLFAMPCVLEAATLAQDGLLYDLNTVPHIDLKNEWWCQSFNDTVTIADETYFVIGDIGYVSKDATMFVAFNKHMADTYRITEKYGYNNLYEMVDAKAWTQDVMYEMAKSVYQDTNNNNKCDLGDINGMSGQNGVIYWQLIAGGENIIKKDEEGYPLLQLNNERAIRLIEQAQDYFLDPKCGYISADDYFDKSSIPVTDVIIPEFKADRCLFFYNALLNLEFIRDMESDFGVIPPPMFDDTQEGYISNIGSWSATCLCVPTSVVGDDLELAGYFIEALAAASKATLNPVYYEQTLQYQISRDDDSMRMLDIIFDSRRPELAEVYRWGSMVSVVSGMLKSPKGTFVSKYEAAEMQTQLEIDETLEAFNTRNEIEN